MGRDVPALGRRGRDRRPILRFLPIISVVYQTKRGDERFLPSLLLPAREGGRCKLARMSASLLVKDNYFTALPSKVRSYFSTAPARQKTRLSPKLGTRRRQIPPSFSAVL